MSITTANNVFIPQSIGDLAVDVLFKRTPLLASSVVSDARQMGFYSGQGKDITFVSFTDPLNLDYEYLLETSVSNSRDGVSGYAFAQSSYVETLQEKTISIDFDGHLFNDTIPGQLKSFYADIVAKKSAAAIQRDLLDKAEDTNLVFDVTGESTKTLTCDYILAARMEWGEMANSAIPALFISSSQYKDLAQTSDFKTLAAAFNRSIVDANVNSAGPIAKIHGVDVWLCDSITKTGSDYTAIMGMPGALGLYIKDVVALDPIRHAGSTVVTLDYHFRWASTLYRNSPRGTVKLITR